MAITPSVEEILEKDLFELLDIEKVDEAKKQQILTSMINTVDARVIGRVAELLTEQEADKFKELAEAGDSQKLIDYLVEKEIDLPRIVSEEATRHRIEVVQLLRLAEGK